VLADMSFISPSAGDTFYANNSITITFKESNNVPLISDFQQYSILLGYSNDTKKVRKKPDSHSLSSLKYSCTRLSCSTVAATTSFQSRIQLLDCIPCFLILHVELLAQTW
jgi:hypothetical protein